MKSIFFVFLGGGFGSILRFYFSGWINTLHNNSFPWATMLINITACLVLGSIIGYGDSKLGLSSTARLFWVVGFCGGFSTFSTFANESMFLLINNLTLPFFAYIFGSVVLCVGAIYLGLYLGNNL